MPNKRDSAGVFVTAERGKELATTRRPSSKGNVLAMKDYDDPITDYHGARRTTNSNTDGAESDASSDQANRTRKKAEPVKSACVQCQKRKTKCSGQRPVCRFCSDRNLECSWDIGDGLTRTADLKRKLLEATGKSDNLDTLVDAMRDGSDEVSTMLLARLRLGASVKDLAYGIRSDAFRERDSGQASESSPSQTSDSRERKHNSDTSERPSPTTSHHPFDWSGPSSQIHPDDASGNRTMDATAYQPTSPQSFLTSEFDQSRMTWRTGNPFHTSEDGNSGFQGTAPRQQNQPQFQRQQQQRQKQQSQPTYRHNSVNITQPRNLDTKSSQRGAHQGAVPVSDDIMR